MEVLKRTEIYDSDLSFDNVNQNNQQLIRDKVKLFIGQIFYVLIAKIDWLVLL